MANEKNNPQLPFGLNTDTEPTKQAANTYRFALNAVHDDKEGSLGSLVNENGNISCFPLETGFTLLGHVPISDGSTVVITKNLNTGVSEIGIKSLCDYTSIITTDCFDFEECFQVKGEFKVRQGCERVITLYDCNGDDKYINLDRLELYYTEAFEMYLDSNPGTTPEQYFIDTGLYAWDCNKMRLNPLYDYPCVTLTGVTTGGNLLMGTYQFAVELLDDGFNILGYTLYTQTIPIIDESLGAGWLFKDGGLNLPPNSADIGGVPFTGKSINLRITDLATPISFIRLIVKRNTTGTGIGGENFRLGNIIPVQDTLDITFSGINADEDENFTITQATIPAQIYRTSCAQEQVDTRLIRGNLQEQVYDWGGLQQAANDITSEWTSLDLEKVQDNDEDNTKSPDYYFFKRGYARDEIYAFGIVLRFRDGTFSPVFHIPGRPVIKAGDSIGYPILPAEAVEHGNSNTHYRNQVPRILDGDLTDEDWDEQLLTVISGPPAASPKLEVFLDDVRHLGFTAIGDDIGFGVGLVPRWMVYNTAIQYITNDPFPRRRGKFAYHQSNLRYPEIKNCDGNFIYPIDPDDATMTAFIRHHRFPDNILTGHIEDVGGGDGNEIVPLGVVFDTNSFYAALSQDLLDNLDGHIFVRGKRTENNKTVFDMGNVMGKGTETISGTMYDVQKTMGTTIDQRFLKFVQSPTINFQNKFYGQGFYLKNEGLVAPAFNVVGPDYAVYDYCTVNNSFTPFIHANIDEAYLINPGAVQAFDNLTNDVYNANMGASVLAAYAPSSGNATFINELYVSIKRVADPYSNVTAIQYIPISNCLEEDTSLFSVLSPIYGGDIFISLMSYPYHHYNAPLTLPGSPSVVDDPVLGANYEGMVNKWCFESTVNSNFRHSGTEPCNKYYEKNFEAGSVPAVAVSDYFTLRSTAGCEPEFFAYNPDYSISLNENIFLSLPITYNYCSDCDGLFPNRLAFSPKSFETEIADNWKINQANDFIDIDASKGDITNIKFDKNQMLISTEESLFSMAPNPQTIQTDIDTAYLGTGDFLSIPPNQFLNKDHGYAGNQGRYNAINTEHGYIWADQKDGVVFNYFNGKLNEMSNRGMYYWFGNNLPCSLTTKIPDYFCKDNTASDRGVGLMSVYDPTFERYILHKRDFDVIEGVWNLTSPFPDDPGDILVGEFYYDELGMYIGTAPGEAALIPFTDETVFVNKSWTISYSFKTQAWTSWHSYMPNYMFFDNDNFYTWITAFDDVWQHAPRNFQTYYDTKYDFVLEYVTKDFMTHDVHNIHWYSQTQLYDTSLDYYEDIEDQTFDKLMIYTRRQNTGKFDLTVMDKHLDPFTNIGWSNTDKQVILTDKNWKVGQIRDLATSQPTVTRRWLDIQGEFNNPNGQGYIDLLPYAPSIDTARSQYDLRNMKDKYYLIRLYFSNEIIPDYKIVLDIINTITHKSFR